MAGQVKHTKLFNVRPDWTLGRVLMRLATKNTDSLISGVADVLRDERDRPDRLDGAAGAAARTARRARRAARRPMTQRGDLDFGCRVADAIAGLDIGQTIAVKSGGGRRGRGDGRDRRGHRARGTARRPRRPRSSRWRSRIRTCASTCRLPASRPIEAMAAAGATALSVDAGKTLMIDGDAIIRAADEAGISIVGRPRHAWLNSTTASSRRLEDTKATKNVFD